MNNGGDSFDSGGDLRFHHLFQPLLCPDALRVALRNSPALTPTIPEVAVHDGRGYANIGNTAKAVKEQLRA
jgi:hypothetical protein